MGEIINNNNFIFFSMIILTLIIIHLIQMTNKNIQSYRQYNERRLRNIENKSENKKGVYKEDEGPSRIWTTSRMVNVPTRGETGPFHTVGYLTNRMGDVLPLTGRQTYPGSNHWNYYTTTDTHLKIQIPVFNHDPANNPKDDCLDDRGCLEFNTGDYAWANNIRYKVTMHRYRTLRYIP